MRSPLVAVAGYRLPPGRISGWDVSAIAVPEYYLGAVRRAGGRPAVVSGPDAADPSEIVEPFDALLIVGGGDVDPSRYGADPHPEVYGTDVSRDDYEIGLVQAAMDLDKPVLGICRGIQVLNVAFGGTLEQHLDDTPGRVAHGWPTKTEPWVSHDVRVSESSRLAEATGQVTFPARAAHHQAVDRLGAGLSPVAWTEDGVVEAIESDRGWVVGVQWHPERTAAEDRIQQGIFDAFARAAATTRTA